MSVLLAPQKKRNRRQQLSVRSEAAGPIESRRVSRLDRQFRQLVLGRLEQQLAGQLTFADRDASFTLGSPSQGLEGSIEVRDPRFYRMAVLGGSLAVAEAYIRGYWDSTDLVMAMRVLARRTDTMASMERGMTRLLRPIRNAMNWMKRNTRTGSRKNISAHYDLSNDFFALMLDPTMTYSSGIFETPFSSLEDASIAKYERICRKLELSSDDHVLEVGCGWGGFAIHAARQSGCRVTATTISREQFALANQRIHDLGLDDRITLLLTDYRDLAGQYDKLVSIEMIEAVGERFFDTYFEQCSRLLKPNGMMALQAITIPDHRYDGYRSSVDFIQRYIFPGGFLPSFGAIGQSLRRATDFRVLHLEDFGMDYAETLSRWRQNFWEQIEQVRELGFDDRFIRTWHYYLSYCEAGFRERQIGVNQLVLAKPLSHLR